MEQERCLLLDADTLSAWLFMPMRDHRRTRLVLDLFEIPADVTLYVAFSTVADLYHSVRHTRDLYRSDGHEEKAASFFERAEHILERWLQEKLNVRYADEILCQRWIQLLNLGEIHENASREHVWLVTFAQELRDNRRLVTIVSEEPEIYNAYKKAGLLENIEVMQRGG
jgi:hypothetical protein